MQDYAVDPVCLLITLLLNNSYMEVPLWGHLAAQEPPASVIVQVE